MELVYNDTINDYICRADMPLLSVKSVEAKPDYTLHLTFSNGESKVYSARPLLTKAIFAPLKNIAFFLNAHADGCSVAWSDEIDLDPEYLYKESLPVLSV